QMVFVRSTPSMGGDCRKTEALETCGRPREKAVRTLDPAVAAAQKIEGAHLVDLTDAICTPSTCNAVVGNVAVYRGAAHLTDTYARSLAPVFAATLAKVAGQKLEVPEVGALPLPTDLPQRAVEAKRDNPDLYADGCHANQASTEPSYCVYGDRNSSTRIVLTGDSHAAQWLPPLQDLARKNGWAVYSFTKSACAFSDAAVAKGGKPYESCTAWNSELMEKLGTLAPSLVVTSQSRGHRALGKDRDDESDEALAEGLLTRWSELRSRGVPVLV